MLKLIESKRDGREWSAQDIAKLIKLVCNHQTADFQIAAVLMAIYLNGMSDREITDLTAEMVHSGQRIDLSHLTVPVLDKHSTGGVGDKTSLILLPMIAACGLKTVKLSGKGLGHTGGTLDKLSTFPGFRTDLEVSEIIHAVETTGFVISGQTEALVPADKRLYALRDLTATVDSLPLIASSIMSKKISTGASGILLDVKTGNGAVFSDIGRARSLAKKMVQIGTALNVETRAVLTPMSSPLGYAVGNSLEVKEAILMLQNQGSAQLRELCLEIGSRMIMMSGRTINMDDARTDLMAVLDNGKALDCFRSMIVNQGGDPAFVDHPQRLPLAPLKKQVLASADGFISGIHAKSIGVASMLTGAGRQSKEQAIDIGAGILLNKKVGDRVQAGDLLLTVYSSEEKRLNQATEIAENAVDISQNKPEPISVIIEEIS